MAEEVIPPLLSVEEENIAGEKEVRWYRFIICGFSRPCKNFPWFFDIKFWWIFHQTLGGFCMKKSRKWLMDSGGCTGTLG
jgi:hypothetical protein